MLFIIQNTSKGIFILNRVGSYMKQVELHAWNGTFPLQSAVLPEIQDYYRVQHRVMVGVKEISRNLT